MSEVVWFWYAACSIFIFGFAAQAQPATDPSEGDSPYLSINIVLAFPNQ